jgi:hypothetical protein
MSIPTFTQGYPPDNSSLGQTKATIRDNLDGSFLTLAVDHINNNGQPGAKPAGYHKVIHMVPQAANPAPVAGYGQLYSRTITSITNDQALFWETGAGLVSQLTMNIAPLATQNGYSYLPGGILMQWGFVNQTSATTVNVVFPQAFPNNCLNVQVTRSHSSSSPGNNSMWVITTPTTAGFSIKNDDGHTWGYYWVAIGN